MLNVWIFKNCHLLKRVLLNSYVSNFRNGKKHQYADYLAYEPLCNLTYIGIKSVFPCKLTSLKFANVTSLLADVALTLRS